MLIIEMERTPSERFYEIRNFFKAVDKTASEDRNGSVFVNPGWNSSNDFSELTFFTAIAKVKDYEDVGILFHEQIGTLNRNPHRPTRIDFYINGFKKFIEFLYTHNTVKNDKNRDVQLDRLKDYLFTENREPYPMIEKIIEEVLVDSDGDTVRYEPSEEGIFSRTPGKFVLVYSPSGSASAASSLLSARAPRSAAPSLLSARAPRSAAPSLFSARRSNGNILRQVRGEEEWEPLLGTNRGGRRTKKRSQRKKSKARKSRRRR
jgi:hypothetical protein